MVDSNQGIIALVGSCPRDSYIQGASSPQGSSPQGSCPVTNCNQVIGFKLFHKISF